MRREEGNIKTAHAITRTTGRGPGNPLQANTPACLVQTAGQQHQPFSATSLSVDSSRDNGQKKRAVQFPRTASSTSAYLHLIEVGRERAWLAHCSVAVLSHQPAGSGGYRGAAADCGREIAYGRGTGTTLLLSWRPAAKEKPRASKPRWKGTGGPQCTRSQLRAFRYLCPQSHTLRNMSTTPDFKACQCFWLDPTSSRWPFLRPTVTRGSQLPPRTSFVANCTGQARP